MQKKFKEIENQLIEKRKYEKINVAFFISLISMFPAKPFFEFLLKQEKWGPKRQSDWPRSPAGGQAGVGFRIPEPLYPLCITHLIAYSSAYKLCTGYSQF